MISSKRMQAGPVRLPSLTRPFAGHVSEDRAAAHNRELAYLRTLTLYTMR